MVWESHEMLTITELAPHNAEALQRGYTHPFPQKWENGGPEPGRVPPEATAGEGEPPALNGIA